MVMQGWLGLRAGRKVAMPTTTPSWILRYAMGIACAGLAIQARLLLRPILHDELPFDTLFGGIAIGVWYGGYGPALLTAVLGFLGANYFFLEPQGSLGLHGSRQWVGLAGYIVSSSLIILFGEAMHRARRREKSTAQQAME